MLEKYRAVIEQGRITWQDEVPRELKSSKPIIVDVSPVEPQPKPKRSNGKKMAAILRKIAETGGISSIKDPVKWQREIRKDRPLPGRE